MGYRGNFRVILLFLRFFPVLIQCLEFFQALVCIHVHGTELEEIKYVVVTPHPFGFIYNGAFTFHPDGHGCYYQKRGEANDGRPGKENVKCPFPTRQLESSGIIGGIRC